MGPLRDLERGPGGGWFGSGINFVRWFSRCRAGVGFFGLPGCFVWRCALLIAGFLPAGVVVCRNSCILSSVRVRL